MKQVLISGASSGIGLSLVEAFLECGYFVFAGARNAEPLQKLLLRFPQSLEILKLDVTSAADIESAFAKVSVRSFSESFVLINNAGVAVGGPLESLPVDEWRKAFEVNVFGLVGLTKRFLPLIRKTRGRIINIGSISGRIANPYLGPYCGSKFAVRAITDSLRREMRSLGVKVVLIEPGPVKTAIWEKSIHHSQDLKAHISAEEILVYGEAIENLTAAVEEVARQAVPVSWVVDKVVHAAESKNPCAYYLVGRMIHLQAWLAKFLPTLWMDLLLAQGFRFHQSKNKN